MTIEDYIEQARCTETAYAGVTIDCMCLDPHDPHKLIHYAIGLCTEALELQAAIRHNLPDHERLAELGDICWFSGLAAAELGEPPLATNYRKYPTENLSRVFELCEEFGTRIKAALCYGTPVKKADRTPDYWKQIPQEIFCRAVVIGNAHVSRGQGGILDLNIAKLRARYGEKFSAYDALHRDIPAESKAISELAVQQVPGDTDVPRRDATSASSVESTPTPNLPPKKIKVPLASDAEMFELFGRPTKTSDEKKV